MGTLYFIGLGLYDVTDISLKGLNRVQTCDTIFAEFYTSVIPGSTIEDMNDLFGKEVRVLTREEVEGETIILDALEQGNCVLLTGGDPMSATTHQSLRIEAINRGHAIEVVHASSVFTAIPGLLGLPTYKFGRTTTLARPEGDYFPTSPYEVIQRNIEMDLHSLVLLDIKAHENYYMTANEGIDLLLRMENLEEGHILTPERKIAVVARAGSPDPFLWYGTLGSGREIDFGEPLHSIVIPATCHFMEQEMLDLIGSPGIGEQGSIPIRS
jgi:diphthine synthase